MKNKSERNGFSDQQVISGLALAYNGAYEMKAGSQAVTIRQKHRDRVAIVVSGSVGYEAMLGAVLGENLADALIIGSGTDPYSIMRTAISVNYGKGVLFICSNEEKERESFLSAGGLLDEAGIDCEVVYAWDNISPGGRNDTSIRRSSAGVFFCTKIAGAAAACGLPLKEIYRTVREARNYTNSLSVCLGKGRELVAVNSLFELPDKVELDIGMVGNAIDKDLSLNSAEAVVSRMAYHLILASGIRIGDEVCTYVSGFGGTSLSDFAIINYYLKKKLEEKGIRIHDMVINPAASKYKTFGATISVLQLDEKIKKYYDMPCDSLYFKKN